MAGTDRTPTDPLALYRALAAEPYRFGFFAALRRLECAHRDKPLIGESLRPIEDAVRLAQSPSLIFAPATLARFDMDTGGRAPRLEVYFLGLFGPQGPLPLHLTEYARDRLRNSDDPTLVRFADLFHHRMLSLFYRAWALAQPAVGFDRPEHNRFMTYIGSLFGIGRPTLQNRDAMPDAAKVYYSGRLSCQARHAEGLEAMIADFFRIPAQVLEFIGEWVALPENGCCRMGSDPEVSSLGVNVIVGTRIWEGQQKFRIRLGPVTWNDYGRLLPGGDSLRRLLAMVKNYIGDELAWDLNLVLRREEVPALRLGAGVQLGWSTWLTGSMHAEDPADLQLDPIAFAGQPGLSSAGA